VTEVESRLAELSIKADIQGRPKHLWSIYEKMVVKGKSFDEIYDLIGVRVVVDTVKDLLRGARLASTRVEADPRAVQGLHRHAQVQPLPVVAHDGGGARGKALEVQIRTWEMHTRAEYGVAAHWEYKEKQPPDEMAWLSRIVEWQQETIDPSQFMANLKVDLQHDEVFVFTPKGKIITLPVGATPIDFAYAIHTEVGHKCIGSRVNGRLVPLETRCRAATPIEIFTSKVQGAGRRKTG
jgi:GTP pyrophosphokinase